jgi:hypothetical protein
MNNLKEIENKTYQGFKVEFGKLIREGEFVSGNKTFTFQTITVNGVKFDTKTLFAWDDPDFPDGYEEEINEAENNAIADGKTKNDWTDYLDWSKQTYHFKSEAFMVYEDSEGLNIDALPKNTPLGRIPIKDLIVNGDMALTGKPA